MASVLDLIGNTPLIEVTRIDHGPCRLFLKLESANPSGSLKDRPARAMIEAAEADGRLKRSGTIVEATAGNTGLGLALRSEEHTSELQSRLHLVCRLLLEKKKTTTLERVTEAQAIRQLC